MFARLKNKLSLIFTKYWSFLRLKNKLGTLSFILLATILVVSWFVFSPPVFADTILGDIGGGIRNFFTDVFFGLAGLLIKITFFFLKFVIEIGGYNGYIDSPAVIVGWVMVRDMTNMFFVIVLLVISFGTILGLEQYEYKKLLVKLLVAAIIVNFSRIICGVIIDIAQVVMITFVNGIAATASGNMVNMFNVDDVFRLGNGGDKSGLDPNALFFASVIALVFGSMMLVTMATFVLLLLARMAMLWVLIVLSPFAFVLNVVPQTEKYAGQWWSQFSGHVVGGPIIAFFLWLSFVTVGSGAIHDDIKKYNSLSPDNLITSDPTDPQESTGVTNVMSYAKMANFFIAIAMLLAGAKMATELGMVGGDMMGKAKDLGKKVAMYASGFNAARWAGAGVAKGAKATGKFVAMKFPGIGGEAWIRRGKTIGGWAGTKLERLQFWRNEKAKNLETESKKLRDLEFKRKHNQISEEDYRKEMEALAAKKEGFKGVEGKKNKDAAALEAQRKEGKITEEQYEQKMKQLNEDYHGKMVNLANKGMLGRGLKGVFAGLIETGGRKMDRADNWMEAYEEAKERTGLEYSNSSFAGGQLKREMGELKEMSEETKKAKGERKRAEMRLGALRDLTEGASTAMSKQAENMVKAEMQVRDWKGQVEVGKVQAEHEVLKKQPKLDAMYRSEAEAKAAKEGHHADEEKRVMDQEIELLKQAAEALKNSKVAVLGPDGKPTDKKVAVGDLEKQIEAKRKAMELLKARKTPSDAKFDSKVTLELLKQLKLAGAQKNGSDEQKAILAAIEADKTGMRAAYGTMFGDGPLTDVVYDQKNLEALGNIEKAIMDRGASLNGTETGDVVKTVMASAAKEIEAGVNNLNHVWEHAAHSSPSLYAARSSALRDHTYAYYRGKKQEIKDNAAQSEIWDKMRIETPSGAAQQSVAEELYAKNFKDMKYNQAMAAQRGYQEYIARKVKDNEEVTEQDRLVGMAIVQRLMGESQMDDALVGMMADNMGLKDRVGTLLRIRDKTQGEAVRLSKEEISKLGNALSGLAGFDHADLERIKNGDTTVEQQFKDRHRENIRNNPHEFDGKSVDQIIHIVKKIANDQHNELVAAAKKTKT